MKPKLLVLCLLSLALVAGSACGDDDDGGGSGGDAKTLQASDSDVSKIVKENVGTRGLEGSERAPLKGGANVVEPGSSLDTTGLEDGIAQIIKERTGMDVRVECPPTVQYAPGAIFYCKLYLPNGTALDIKCTQRDSTGQEVATIDWEIVNGNPVPEPPPGDQTSELRDAKDERRLVRGGAANRLQPGDVLDTSTLGDSIEEEVKRQTGLDVTVECPATVEYSVGSTFYCKLYTSDGTAYDVECTQEQDGAISWRVIT